VIAMKELYSSNLHCSTPSSHNLHSVLASK